MAMGEPAVTLSPTEIYAPNFPPGDTLRGVEVPGTTEVHMSALQEVLPCHDLPNQPAPTEYHSTEDQWYFGLAAMMNPTSLEGRELAPVESRPGELLDYELAFEPLAVAVAKSGSSFHGVLHLFSAKDMQTLDNIETSMGRKNIHRVQARARLYNGQLVDCTIYQGDRDRLSSDLPASSTDADARHTPSQRYVDIMIEGAKHFGVKKEYIDSLVNLTTLPRPDLHEYKTFEVPANCRALTWDDSRKSWSVEKSLGRQEAMQIAINGKVLEWIGPTDTPVYKALSTANGTDITLSCAKLKYDPKFGIPRKYEDMGREHCLFVEDHFCNTPFAKYFKVVGICFQPLSALDKVAPRTAMVSESLGGSFVNPSKIIESDHQRRRGSHYHRPLPEGLLPASIHNVKFSVDYRDKESVNRNKVSFNFRAIGN